LRESTVIEGTPSPGRSPLLPASSLQGPEQGQ
jgi:hypothetical protein